MEVGGERVIHLSLHCHHQNDFCNKLGAILMFHNNIVRDKVTRQCPQTTIFEVKGERNRFEPTSLCLPAWRLTARPKLHPGPEQFLSLAQCLLGWCSVCSSAAYLTTACKLTTVYKQTAVYKLTTVCKLTSVCKLTTASKLTTAYKLTTASKLTTDYKRPLSVFTSSQPRGKKQIHPLTVPLWP